MKLKPLESVVPVAAEGGDPAGLLGVGVVDVEPVGALGASTGAGASGDFVPEGVSALGSEGISTFGSEGTSTVTSGGTSTFFGSPTSTFPTSGTSALTSEEPPSVISAEALAGSNTASASTSASADPESRTRCWESPLRIAESHPVGGPLVK